MPISPDITGNPYKVTGTTSTSTKVTDNWVYIKFIRWYKPTTVGHLLSVTNKEGKDITDGYCDTANLTQDIPVFCGNDGIYIDDMDSGTVFIYVR